MSRRDDPAMVFAVIVVGSILMFAMNIGAPFKVTLIGTFSALFVFGLYCVYFYFAHGFSLGFSRWERSDRYWRVWPLALMVIYWAFIPVIDQAGTVEYHSIFMEKKKFLFETEAPWYSMWYTKVVVSIAIVLIGHFLHHAISKLWYENVRSF